MESALSLSHEFLKAHPLDATRILEGLRDEQTAAVLEKVPPPIASGVIGVMNPVLAASCLELMRGKRAAAIVAQLPAAVASLLLRRMGEVIRENIRREVPPDVSEPLKRLLKYPVGTAGSVMDPNVFVSLEDEAVKAVLKNLRNHPDQTMDYVYVVNRQHGFVGYNRIQELMKAPVDARMADIVRRDMGRLSPNMTDQAVLRHPGWHDFHAMPVVEENGLFLGAVGYSTLRRIEDDGEQVGGDRLGGAAGTALAELYGIGLSGLLRWAAAMMKRERT